MKPILFRSARRALAALLLCGVAAAAQLPGVSSDDPAERLSGYLRTLAGDPRDVTALNGAGRAALEIGDVNGALGFYGRAEQAAPQNGDAKAGLAAALVQLEQPRRALPLFAQAVQLGVPAGRIAADRGLAYDLLGDNASAQRDYAVALAADESDETRRRYALSLGISGQRQKALDLLDPLVRRRDPAGWRARAFVLALTGDTPSASAIVEAMMPSQSSAMQPFLVELSGLTPAQKAAAVNFGDMPSAASAGGAGTQLAAREAMPMPVPAPVGAMLVPGGAPLGRTPSPAPATVVAAMPAPSSIARAPARQPVVPLDRSVALAVIRRQAGVAAPPPRAAPALPLAGAAAPVRLAENTNGPPAAVFAKPAPAPLPSSSAPASPPPDASSAPAAPAPVPAPGSASVSAVPAQPAAIAPPDTAAASPPAARGSTAIAAASAPPPGLIGPPAPVPDRVAVIAPPPASIATTELPASSVSSEVAAPAPIAPPPPPRAPNVPARHLYASPEPSAPHATRIEQAVAKPVKETADEKTSQDARSQKTKSPRSEPSDESGRKSEPASSGKAGHDATGDAKSRSGASEADDPAPDKAGDADRARGGRSRSADADKTDRSEKTHDGRVRDKPAKADDSAEPRKATDSGSDDDDKTSRKAKAAKSRSADEADTQSTKKKTRSNSADEADSSSERVYVQVAGGANKDDMDKAWAGVKKQAPALLKGKTPSTTPLRFTNRLLIGPFKDEDEAQGFVNKLAGKGMSGFVFKSAKGQKIEKVDTAK